MNDEQESQTEKEKAKEPPSVRIFKPFYDFQSRRLKGIGSKAVVVYLDLSAHVNWKHFHDTGEKLSYPSVTQIAYETGMSSHTVVRALKRLESLKLVKKKRQTYSRANRYLLQNGFEDDVLFWQMVIYLDSGKWMQYREVKRKLVSDEDNWQERKSEMKEYKNRYRNDCEVPPMGEDSQSEGNVKESDPPTREIRSPHFDIIDPPTRETER